MKRLLFVLFLLFAFALPAFAQEPVQQNPTTYEFDCPEHAADYQHELKIIEIQGTNKLVITTILLGDPDLIPGTTTNRVRGSINVQPIKHGRYVSRVNAIVATADGDMKSPDSDESNVWERTPGRPDKLQMGGASGSVAARIGEAVIIALP